MERFTLAQAAAWTHGEAKGEAALTAVTTDSRQIPPEALFLPIKGERFDAHDFIGKAIENGAAAVMSHRENEEYPVPALYVENTSQAQGGIPLLMDTLEILGADNLAHGRWGEQKLVVRLPHQQRPAAGSTLWLHLPLEHLHLFDGETGQRA